MSCWQSVRIAVDLDGTLVESAWPGIGDWRPGAIEALREMQRDGHHVFIFTMRTSEDVNGRYAAALQRQQLEAFLDEADVDVPVWDGRGKPRFDLLIDDRAMWISPRRNAWAAMMDKIRAKEAALGKRVDEPGGDGRTGSDREGARDDF